MFKSEFNVKVIEAFKSSTDNRIMITTDEEIFYLEKSLWNERSYHFCEELNIIKPNFFNLFEFASHIYTLLCSKGINILGVYC